MNKDDFPVYKLFLDGNLDGPVDFTGDAKKADDLKRFIMKESGEICFQQLTYSLFKGDYCMRNAHGVEVS